MNKIELLKKLEMLKILSYYFSLDSELKSDRIVLTEMENNYEVCYFSKRGSKNWFKSFQTENEGCNFICEHFKNYKEVIDKYKLNY